MVEGGATAHTGQCQSVDFVGCSKFYSSMADRHIAQNATVVGVIVSSVFSEVVIGRDPFDFERDLRNWWWRHPV